VVPSLVPMVDIIAFDSGKRVVALDVVPRRRPYRTRDGRFYMRFGAEKREIAGEQLWMWLDEVRPLGYENVPLFNCSENDFDDALLWSFAGGFEEIPGGQRELYQTAEFLKKDLLLAVGNADEFFPTVAGVLLFGKSDRVASLLPKAGVTVARYSGGNGGAQLIESREITGNLLTVFEGVQNFVQRYVDLLKARPKKRGQAEESPPVAPRSSYHIYSVKEAIVNALVHRDYALREIATRINIYDNAIEFVNARRSTGFAPPASRAIRYGITQRLNPQMAAVFGRREYGAGVPQGGVPMILRQSLLFSGKRPELYTAGDEFRLKIYGT
jgi:ATP-dependent DNA helicase RecG